MKEVRDDIQLLYDFWVVAKEGKLNVAADLLYTSSSNLSKRISTLEGYMNQTLMIRDNKGVKLTPAGEQLFKRIGSEMDSLTSIYDTSDKKGSLIIGTTRNIADNYLSKNLIEFKKNYPNVFIKIVTDNAANLNSYLIEHKIDFLIDYFPQINFIEKYNFETKILSEFKTCFACNKDFYKKIGNNITSLKELNNYNLVIPGSSRRRQMLDEILQRNNVVLNPTIEMPDSKLMVDFVKNTEYIGYFIKEELNDTDLIELNINEDLPLNSFGIVYLKNYNSNYHVKNFIKLILND